MKVLDRIAAVRAPAEKRTIGGVPWVPFVPFGSGGPVHPSRYHHGQDQAIALAPVYGAVRLLADGVASLPIKIYRNMPDGSTAKWGGPSIFDKPGPRGTIYDWLWECMSSLLLQGNALGYITSRDGFGYPTCIVWLPYQRCHIQDHETADFANPVRPRYYYMGREMAEENLLHIKAFTVPGQTAGVSPLGAFRMLFESGHDMQNYSAGWFRNGGFPPGTFRNIAQEVDPEQSREIRANLTETMRLRQPLVYGSDWEYQPVNVPPGEAQFVETVRLNATQIAAIYGVPPERIGGTRGDSLTYNTQEQGTNDLITWSLRPWLVRLETAFFDILPVQRRARFNPDAMIRTDTLTRHQVFELDRKMGLKTVNQLRDIDDDEPLTSGVGDEELPLDVLVAMARGMASIPASFEKLLVTQKAPAPTVALHHPGQPAPGSVPGSPGVAPGSGSAPPLNVVPSGSAPPPQAHSWQGGPHYSAEQIARACFGFLAAKQEYVDHVCQVARDGGYVVIATRAESFSKDQAEWIAAEARNRPRPVEYGAALNGSRGKG